MPETEETYVTTRADTRYKGQGPDRRRQARLAAVQALYQVELGEMTADRVVTEFLQYRLDETIDGIQLGRIDRGLFGDIVKGVVAHRTDLIDSLSGALAEGWSFERLERLLRIIMMCGLFELAHRPATPARTAIHEYVDLAKAFFDDREPRMVNGVLDHLAQVLRPEEIAERPDGEGDRSGTRDG
ncbi:transcription antitermination factor NusB [Rhodovibrio salinarum]|nr:transcription antitermination factor NusB [Rhodovibrio salinarum]